MSFNSVAIEDIFFEAAIEHLVFHSHVLDVFFFLSCFSLLKCFTEYTKERTALYTHICHEYNVNVRYIRRRIRTLSHHHQFIIMIIVVVVLVVVVAVEINCIMIYSALFFSPFFSFFCCRASLFGRK